MKRGFKPTILFSFVEDMYALRSAGYERRIDYANRLGISLVCFDQRMNRARRAGLLPPTAKGRKQFLPFGEPWTREDTNA